MKSALFTVLLFVGAAHAQQTFAATSPVPDAPSTQKFWSLENKIDFSILAGQITVDAITTQYGLNHGFRESNPVMRPLVTRGVGGEAAASALGLGFGVGTAYLLHKTHHYKAERIAARTMLAVEGGFVANNLSRLY
jgi:opacity protein-like surface antigen